VIDKYKLAENNSNTSNNLNIDSNQNTYFELVQNFVHYSSIPQSQPIYTYSFALYPENDDYQPTGSVNFSRLNAPLTLQYIPYEERNQIILGCQKRWMYR